jgi:signal peptidase I
MEGNTIGENNIEENSIKENKNFTWEIIDFLKDLFIIIIIVLLITKFLISIFIISGQSMYSSYYDKEFILVDRFSALDYSSFKKQDVKRWDVVVIMPEVDPSKKYYIKRVVWMPGETLKIEWWRVFVKKIWKEDFEELNEKYLSKENYQNTEVDTQRKEYIYIIPENKYFVIWDNRAHSSDSRSCFQFTCSGGERDNFIAKDKVVWKVLLDLWYFNFSNFSFTHSYIKKDWKPISTKPKWTHSVDSYRY